MAIPKNARCIEVEVGGSMVALCLAMNADRANEEYDGYYHNCSEYGDWTEVTDGTKKTVKEKVTDAAKTVKETAAYANSYAWNNGPNISGPSSKAMNYAWEQVGSGINSIGARWKGGGGSNAAPGAQAPVQSTSAPLDNGSISSDPMLLDTSALRRIIVHDGAVKAPEGDPKMKVGDTDASKQNAESDASNEPTTDASGSDQDVTTEAKQKDPTNAQKRPNAKSPTPVSNVHSNSKPKSPRKNKEGKYQMYIGYRTSSSKHHEAECDIENMRPLITAMERNVKVYQSASKKNNGNQTVEHKQVPGVTAEMYCLWKHLTEKVRTQGSRSNRYAMLTDTTTQKSIRLDMVSDNTLLYTEENSNQIVLVNDDEEDDVEVKVAEVLVKQGSPSGYNRTVLYTDSCLSLTNGVKLKEPRNSNVKRYMKILIFCLLVVTGWGFYSKKNQTTEVSAYGFTLSVNQDENEKMFDTNTEFTLTESVSPELTGTEWSAKSAQKTDKSATEGQTVRQIVTRSASREAQAASAAKQANEAELTRKLRSAGKQHAESSEAKKARETNHANKSNGSGEAGEAGEASNKKAAKKASDTSPSSSSDEATAKVRRSERLQKLAKIKSKYP